MSASTHGTPASGYGTGSLRLAAVFLLLLLGGLPCYFSTVCSYVSARSSCHFSNISYRGHIMNPTNPWATDGLEVMSTIDWLFVCLFLCLFIRLIGSEWIWSTQCFCISLFKTYDGVLKDCDWQRWRGIAPRKNDFFFVFICILTKRKVFVVVVHNYQVWSKI